MSTRSSWCNTHRGPTDHAIAVAVIEVNSGPGGTVWSCPDCVERYGIVPLDEQSPDHPASRIQYRNPGTAHRERAEPGTARQPAPEPASPPTAPTPEARAGCDRA